MAVFDPDVVSEKRPKPFTNANPAPAKPASRPAATIPQLRGTTPARALGEAVRVSEVVTVAIADYFTPLPDAEVPPQHLETLAKYRRLATDWGVSATTPLCYRVRAGFTLKQHATHAGRCHKKFSSSSSARKVIKYLQKKDFSDEATEDCLVFWIPCIVPKSTWKNAAGQLRRLAKLRSRLGLPSHHLSSVGGAALIAGLTFAHYKETNKRVPSDHDWVRTDTRNANGDCLYLGDFGKHGLGWDHWDPNDDPPNFWIHPDDVGCFALGIEPA